MRIDCQTLYFLTIACILFSTNGCSKSNVGLLEGKLKPCPDSPNCVSSMATDTSHYIEPIRYTGSMVKAREAVLSVLQTMKRTRVVTVENNYIHAECRSLVFRFVDDLEFYFEEQKSLVHIKSESRVGYSDLGVNRRRVEDLRRQLTPLISSEKS